jgi:SAM-dependent methyltransferase
VTVSKRYVDVRTGYRFWAQAYPPKAHNRLMELEEEAMLDLLGDAPAGRPCLDLACGSGRYTGVLEQRGATVVAGVDLSLEMLLAPRDFGTPLGRVAQADMLAVPFRDESFGVVLSALAVGHVADLAGVVAEAARVLTPGGVFVYSDLHPFCAMLGRERMFTGTDGVQYVLEHRIHTIEDHITACRRAGLRVEAVREMVDQEVRWDDMPLIPRVLAVRAVAA